MSERSFRNPYHDVPDSAADPVLDNKTDRIHLIKHHEKTIADALKANEVDFHDYSVYTGTSGIALMYLHMHMSLGQDNHYLEKAASLIDNSMKRLKQKYVTFACGDAGPLAIAAVVFTRTGDVDKASRCIKDLLSISSRVLSDEDLPDEFLYGRIGYLSALYFLNHHLGGKTVDITLFHSIYESIIASGQERAQKEHAKCPLMYAWHNKKYLGAAHGIAGILYYLMQFRDDKYKVNLHTLVKPTLDYILKLQFPSGNMPSSLESESGDRLVHWCHGAPGWVLTLIAAYEVFKDDIYLHKAQACGDVVWSRGILKKGYGLCHGTAGNAYTFLALYKATGEHRHLYRALKFSDWCADYGKHGCRIADRPYSLFEGLAGAVYFWIDLLNPQAAKFPAYEITEV